MKIRLVPVLLSIAAVACGPAERPGPDGGGDPVDAGGGGGTDAGGAPDAGSTPDAGGGGGTGCTATGATGDQGGDTCGDAIALTLKCEGTLELTGTTVDATNAVSQAESSSCRGSAKSADRVYRVTVPAGRTMRASVESGDQTFDPALMLLSADDCGTEMTGCLAWDDTGSTLTVNRVSYSAVNDTDVYLVVDNYNESTGPFTLRVELTQSQSGDTCAGAVPLTSGVTLADQDLTDASDDYNSGSSCRTGRQELAYSMRVPAGKGLRVRVEPDSSFDPVVNVLTGGPSACTSTIECVAARDSGSDGDPEVLTWTNTTGADVDAIILVEAYFASDVGRFSVTATVTEPPGPSLGGETCATAYGMNAPEMLTNEALDGATNDLVSADDCMWARSGPERTYAVAVPAGQQLTVTMTPSSEEDLSLFLIESVAVCEAAELVCAAGDDSGWAGEEESVTWVNASGSTANVVIVVDAPSGVGAQATYDLSVAISAAP